MQFFGHRRRAAPLDEPAAATPSSRPAGPPDMRAAFASGLREGRREERRRRRHPVLGLVVALVALAGAAMFALAAHEGSFERGGQVVDQNLASAAGQAQTAGSDAVARTGAAIKDAGANLEAGAKAPAGR